jgi:transposase
MVVERMREGEKPSQGIASHGFARPVIHGWLKAAQRRGKGMRALASRKGTGRLKKLMAVQERQVFRWIDGKTPRQYQLDGILWLRAIVRELIQREFGVSLSLASIGAYWDVCGDMLKKRMWRRKRPLHRVLDHLPAHKTVGVRDYVSSTNGKLTLHFLPGYAPELNPDEQAWSHVKSTCVAKNPLPKGEKLEPKIHEQLAKIQRNSKLVRSFFRHSGVTYITDL